jgi:hypothetical protein
LFGKLPTAVPVPSAAPAAAPSAAPTASAIPKNPFDKWDAYKRDGKKP